MKTKEPSIWEKIKKEFLKTALIGKKMFSATKETTILNDLHKILGYTLVEKIRKGEIKIDDSEIMEILKRIDRHEDSLNSLEHDVDRIKAS